MKSGGKIRRKRGERWREKDIENDWVIKKEDKKERKRKRCTETQRKRERIIIWKRRCEATNEKATKKR